MSEAISEPINVGFRDSIYSFEQVSKSISESIEKSYSLFIFINSQEGRADPIDAFLPNQYMFIVGKSHDKELVFKRNSTGVITGVLKNALMMSDLFINNQINTELQNISSSGLPIVWNGLEVTPVSTGTLFTMATFSGVFQLNWGRSIKMLRTDFKSPMSHALYLGFNYHDVTVNEDDFTDENSERVSYVAIHGTPQNNWSLLGRSRSSIGCARSRPLINKALFNYIDSLKKKEVMNLDWNFNLPRVSNESPMKVTKPVLIIVFNGYDQKSI